MLPTIIEVAVLCMFLPSDPHGVYFLQAEWLAFVPLGVHMAKLYSIIEHVVLEVNEDFSISVSSHLCRINHLNNSLLHFTGQITLALTLIILLFSNTHFAELRLPHMGCLPRGGLCILWLARVFDRWFLSCAQLRASRLRYTQELDTCALYVKKSHHGQLHTITLLALPDSCTETFASLVWQIRLTRKNAVIVWLWV